MATALQSCGSAGVFQKLAALHSGFPATYSGVRVDPETGLVSGDDSANGGRGGEMWRSKVRARRGQKKGCNCTRRAGFVNHVGPPGGPMTYIYRWKALVDAVISQILTRSQMKFL